MPNHIELNDLGQSFQANDQRVTLFEHLNLSVKQGQSYAITGPSGVGKSSLLMLMAGAKGAEAGLLLAISIKV